MTFAPALTDKQQALLDTAPGHVKRRFRRLLDAIAAIDQAQPKQKMRIAKCRARSLRITHSTLLNLRGQYHQRGPFVLVDKRFSSHLWQGAHARILPASVAHQLQSIAASSLQSNQAVIREFKRHNSGPGTSARNLARYLRHRISPSRGVLFTATIQARADGTWRVFKLSREIK